MKVLRFSHLTAFPMALFFGILTGCASAPRKVPPAVAPVDAKKEFSKVQIEVAAGSDMTAVSKLKSLIEKHPRSDVADDATMLLAQIYYRKGKFDSAYQRYMSLVESDVFSVNEANAILGAARSLHKLGRLEESLALTIRGLKIPGLSDAQRMELYRHRYLVAGTLGDRMEALKALAYLQSKEPPGPNKTAYQTRAQEIVMHHLNEKDLANVSSSSDFGFVAAQAAFRLGVLKLQQRDYDEARKRFRQAAQESQGTPLQAQAERYIEQIESRRRVDPYTIGAVLPMSGKYAVVSERMLNGLELGLGIRGRNRTSLKLAIVDSESSISSATQAVEKLVIEDSVIAIVGSLLSRTSEAVAMKADELGVPSVALSQKAGLTRMGNFIFRNAITSEMQVNELVRVAMEDLGLKKFAILYPNDPYGVEFANLFWTAVKSRGGSIAGAQTYASSETDFRAPIKRLTGTFYLEDRKIEYQNRLKTWFQAQGKIGKRKSPPDDLLPPIVDFDALFVPDSPKAMGQIAPMLSYQGVHNIRLLGANIWNTSEFIRRGQKHVEGAVFIDRTAVDKSAGIARAFYTEFQAAFGYEPGEFEIQGFEVGRLLRQVILEDGQRSRPGLAAALSQIRSFTGVAGVMTMNAQRELSPPLIPYTVKENSIVNLQEASSPTIKK